LAILNSITSTKSHRKSQNTLEKWIGKVKEMDLQARYNRLKEQNRMLIEEARRYEKQIEELQSKIGKLAELNQKAFEVNIELSHKLLTYDKLDQVKRLPLHEGKNENR
jgi:hypothetical protein